MYGISNGVLNAHVHNSEYEFLREIAPFYEWYCKTYHLAVGSQGFLDSPVLEVRRLYCDFLIGQIHDLTTKLHHYLVNTEGMRAKGEEGDTKYSDKMREFFKRSSFKDSSILRYKKTRRIDATGQGHSY